MKKPQIFKDIQKIYKKAMEEGQLSVALKAKELQIKYTQKENPQPLLSIDDLSDEHLMALYNSLKEKEEEKIH
jgi:hypothetical protein